MTLVFTVGCARAAAPSGVDGADNDTLTIPDIAVASERPLRVLATTSIIGDVVGRVGGNAIDLTTLIKPGQDPHSYQPGAADLVQAANAHLIFVNGWDLEEGLVDDLETIGQGAILVPVSAGIQPLSLAWNATEDEEHAHPAAVDPHVWQDVANVMQWVENIRLALGAADPDNAALFDTNAAAYLAELDQLDADIRATLEAIPADQRVLVTNHNNLGYFAAAYDFRLLGTVIPGASTLSEPTARNLAELKSLMESAGVCVVFIESSAGEQLARALTQELSVCPAVDVVTLYSDALGLPGSGADSYIGMMRANAASLVTGLIE